MNWTLIVRAVLVGFSTAFLGALFTTSTLAGIVFGCLAAGLFMWSEPKEGNGGPESGGGV